MCMSLEESSFSGVIIALFDVDENLTIADLWFNI